MEEKKEKRYTLASLVDLGSLQVMADSHFKATEMPIGIIDAYDDSILVGAGWQDICLKFHRIHPESLKRCQESDRTIQAHLEKDKPFAYKCKNGMWDIGMPIIVEERHLATLFLGQFFYDDEIPDREFFKTQAGVFDYDVSEYLSALDKVPVFTHQSVNLILEYDKALVEFIIDLAGKSLLQEEERAERKKLEQQLQQSQKMESIGRLAGGIAHDYNNMLGVIIGYSDIILDGMDEKDKNYEGVRLIYEAGMRSRELNEKLLAFARKQTISPKVLNLNSVIEGILKMLGRLIGENIKLVWSPCKGLWDTKLDPSQIDQVLTNLCVNARDAISGSGRISIETGNEVFDEGYCNTHAGFIPGEYVCLSVSDDGCGMSRDIQASLFEPFFTTKEEGQGTGLGLSMVYGTVRQNGGFINVYSEPGLGTTFKLYFLKDSSLRDHSSSEEKKRTVKTGDETILLVEDDAMILMLTSMMLEGMGYNVINADSPDAAIQAGADFDGMIQLLISDVVMPGMNGKDMAAELCKVHPEMKQLFMSGYTADIISSQGVLDEGVNFIQKPFTNADLSEKVREVLEIS